MSVDKLLIVSPGAFQAYGHGQSYIGGLGNALAKTGTEVHVLGWAGPLYYPAPLRSHAVSRTKGFATRAQSRTRLGPLGDVVWGGARLFGNGLGGSRKGSEGHGGQRLTDWISQAAMRL